MASLHDYEDYARETLSRPLFDHLMAARSDTDLPAIAKEKVDDYALIKLKLRGMLNLRDFQGISTSLFGVKLASPIGVGPLPALHDVGLVHSVSDLTFNKTAILDVCKDLNQVVCVPL